MTVLQFKPRQPSPQLSLEERLFNAAAVISLETITLDLLAVAEIFARNSRAQEASDLAGVCEFLHSLSNKIKLER